MRSVNLIPADAKRAGRGSSGAKALPTYLVLGVLAIAVGLVLSFLIIDALTRKTIRGSTFKQ